MIGKMGKALLVFSVCVLGGSLRAQEKEPPALNPFGPRENLREDALPGFVEMSNGKVHPGQIFLTRDHRLKVLDEKKGRHRLVPLQAVRQIDCKVLKEWMEKEWRFKENANDEKVYTGRSYPAREYVHTVTLKNGGKIQGALAGIVYLQAENSKKAERFLLHKRDKGEVGNDLKSLLYVRSISLGEKALEEGKAKAAPKNSPGEKKKPKSRAR